MGAHFISKESRLWQPFHDPQFGWALPLPHGAQGLCPGYPGPLLCPGGSDRGQGSREEALVGLGERQGGVQRVRECVLGSQQEAGLGFCSPTSFQSWLSHGVSGLSLKNHCSCGWCHGAQTFSCGHTSSDSACNCGTDISPNTLPEILPCPCSWSGQPCRGLALPGPVPRCRCPPLQLCGWARGTRR